MMVLNAGAYAAQELPDVDTFVVVFAEHPDGGGERLELQRSFTFDDQDRALGQDTYCVVVGSGATHYGGVRWWRLGRGALDLELTPEAAKTLGVHAELRVELALSAEDHEELRAGLRRVLAEAPESPAE